MKIIFKLLLCLFFINFNISAGDFKYKVIGKLKTDNVIVFPEGGRFVSFHHEGGFETNVGKYGEYQCRGNILYDKNSKLKNMFFACENTDQNGDRFINMGKRFIGSDMDRAVGEMSIVEGEGFWKSFLGYHCTYAIEYVSKVIFAPAQCKKEKKD